jgi:hypothetical protein
MDFQRSDGRKAKVTKKPTRGLSTRKRYEFACLVVIVVLPILILASTENISAAQPSGVPAPTPPSTVPIGRLNWLSYGYALPANTSMWGSTVLNYSGPVQTVMFPFNATAADIGARVAVDCYANGAYLSGGSTTIQQDGILWALATKRPLSWTIAFGCSIDSNLVAGSTITMIIVANRPVTVLGTYGEGTSYFAPMTFSDQAITTIPQASSESSFQINIYGG